MPYFTIALIVILTCAGMWRMYEKAGSPGWAALVPIYDTIVLLRIAQRPLWWLAIMCVPIVNVAVGIVVWIDVLARFGEPAWRVLFVVIVPFVYLPYLGFSGIRFMG